MPIRPPTAAAGVAAAVLLLAGAAYPGTTAAAPQAPAGSGLDPAYLDVSIRPASVRDLERLTAGTVTATATMLVEGRYHPGITTETRLTYHDAMRDRDRILNVLAVLNMNERDWTTTLVCAEQVE